MTVNLNIVDEPKYLKTNLGKPLGGMIKADSKWYFNHLPEDVLEISYQQDPSSLVQWLIDLNGRIIFIASIMLLGFIHYRLMRWSHKKRSKKAKIILWLGILVVPFIALMMTILRIDVVDWLLGEHASKYHGYTFLIIVFGYPLVLPFYLLIIKLCDSYLKRIFPQPS